MGEAMSSSVTAFFLFRWWVCPWAEEALQRSSARLIFEVPESSGKLRRLSCDDHAVTPSWPRPSVCGTKPEAVQKSRMLESNALLSKIYSETEEHLNCNSKKQGRCKGIKTCFVCLHVFACILTDGLSWKRPEESGKNKMEGPEFPISTGWQIGEAGTDMSKITWVTTTHQHLIILAQQLSKRNPGPSPFLLKYFETLWNYLTTSFSEQETEETLERKHYQGNDHPHGNCLSINQQMGWQRSTSIRRIKKSLSCSKSTGT